MTDTLPKMEMLPCAFCGSAAVLLENLVNQNPNGQFTVMCGLAACNVRSRSVFGKAEAIAAWNRRPPSTGRGDVIEECARVCDNYERNGTPTRTYAHETADEIAARIRALKTAQPSPPGEVEQERATRPDDGPTAPTDRL